MRDNVGQRRMMQWSTFVMRRGLMTKDALSNWLKYRSISTFDDLIEVCRRMNVHPPAHLDLNELMSSNAVLMIEDDQTSSSETALPTASVEQIQHDIAMHEVPQASEHVQMSVNAHDAQTSSSSLVHKKRRRQNSLNG